MSGATPAALRRFSWGLLAYTLGVILWGAYVRASFSGAGCGDHWPLCNGEVVPPSPSVETLVELTHRVTSGLALVGTVLLYVWARRVHAPRHRVRRAAGASLFLMVTEALVGAGLVLFEMVARNTSIARGFWMSAHLVNTFLLLGAMALTAWFATGRPAPRWPRGAAALPPALALVGLLLVGMGGAVAALGDTLFPAATVAQGLADDLSPTAHAFVRLRLYHPILAVVVGLAVVVAVWGLVRRAGGRGRRLAAVATGLYVGELGLGLLNVWLLAPVWLQLVHLLVADLVWLSVVLALADALAAPVPRPAAAAAAGIARASEPAA